MKLLGSVVANCASTRLHKVVSDDPSFSSGNFKDAMRSGYLKLDAILRTLEEVEQEPCGCTAVSALITDSEIVLANAGDSRAVLGSNGTTIPLSFDHKPYNEIEECRIVSAGGYIQCGRVNGTKKFSFICFFIPVPRDTAI